MNPSSRDSITSKKLNLKSSVNYSPLPHHVLIFGVVTQLVQPAEFVACAINTDSTQDVLAHKQNPKDYAVLLQI